MADKPPSPRCGSAGPSKPLENETNFGSSAPKTAPSPPVVPQSDTPNPETFPPMEPHDVRVLPPIHLPTEGDRQLHTAQPYGNSHPHQIPPPFFPHNGPMYPRAPSPMEPRAIYPMSYVPTMGFYPPVMPMPMPMPYGGYHPHPASYPSFTNGLSTQQHFTGTNAHQSQCNTAYQPPAEMVSLRDDPVNRMGPTKPFPNSADTLYKEADHQLPLPSFRSLENATRRSVSGEPPQVPLRCRSPSSNSPPAKKRRVDMSVQGLGEIQATATERRNEAGIEKAAESKPGNEKQQCIANAHIGPSNPNRSEIANTGSILRNSKSTAGSSKKKCCNMSIRSLIHPSEVQSPASNPTQTDRREGPTASRDNPQDAPHIACQSTPGAPYPRAPVLDAPPHILRMPNMAYSYFGNPHHEFRHYPGIAKVLWNPAQVQSYPQGYGSNMMGMHPHQQMGPPRYSGQRFHSMPAGYSHRSRDICPQANGKQNGYESRPSMSPRPIRQHPVQIAPGPSGSSQGILVSNSAQDCPPPGVDLPDRIYDLKAIEMLGCKILKWRVYNEQGHPVCAAPRENGIPCRRNVSRSACKWHGLVVPLCPDNITNGRLDSQGNLIQSFNPSDEASEGGPSETRDENGKPLRSRAQRTAETPETQTRVHRWTDKEHFLFLYGYRNFGKSWAKISKVVQTRTTLQTQSHAQKFFERRRKQEKKKSTIHDLVFESPEMQAIYNSTSQEVLAGYLSRAFAREDDQKAEEQTQDQGQANANSDE